MGYKSWSEPEHKMLLRLLVDAVHQGFRDASGQFNRLTVETRILPVLNEKLGSTKTYANYRNRSKILKTKYQSWSELLRFSSGFGWDPDTKKFTAPDEVWNDYLEAHPGNENLRNQSFEDFEDLRTIYGQNTATGRNAMGSGDTVDAHPNPDSDTEVLFDINSVQIMDDEEEIVPSQHASASSIGKSTEEKLHPKKKAKNDANHSSKVYDEVTEISNQIFGMIQKRWEKEDAEKVVEDKVNNVWDAIKEIPDLDEEVRYQAMTLVHSLGMKYGFVKMSIAERYGWIKGNIRKPST